MENEIFSSYINVAALIAAGILIGMLIGYAFARFGRVSGEGGYSAREQARYDELQTEYDEYRDRVEAHFRETSVVFQQTTEQYRTLYRQIATGAVELCDPQAVQPILESARGTVRAASSLSSAATAAVTHQGTDDSVDESLGSALAEMRAEMNELDHAINDLRKDVLDPKRAELAAPSEPALKPVAANATATATSWQSLADHRPANDSTETTVADIDAARRRSAGETENQAMTESRKVTGNATPNTAHDTDPGTADTLPVRSAGAGLKARTPLVLGAKSEDPELPAPGAEISRPVHDSRATPAETTPPAKPQFANTERLDRMADSLRREASEEAAEKAGHLVPNPRRQRTTQRTERDTIDLQLDKDDSVILQR